MKLFNIDLHISVIEDIKTILQDLGHQVDSVNMSGHNWVFGRQRQSIPELEDWRNINQKTCDEFYKRWKWLGDTYDGFITCYPPLFSLLFENFGKPIYAVVATRYEHPFSAKPESLQWLNDGLIRMIDNGQLIPIANNKFDQWYCQEFLLREFKYIPSLCSYTGANYNPKNSPIVSSRGYIEGLKHVSDLGAHKWDNLYSHQCIIQIPYNTSLMSIFEQYTANVPILVPTMDFGLRKSGLTGFMSEVIFTPSCIDFDLTQLKEKASLLSDFYDPEVMPYINQFDSYTELLDLINELDFNDISAKMKTHNTKRKELVYNLWHSMLK